MGHTRRSDVIYRQVLRIKARLLGEMDPGYAVALRRHAELHIKTGDREAAMRLLEWAVNILRETCDVDHPERMKSLQILSSLRDTPGQAGGPIQ